MTSSQLLPHERVRPVAVLRRAVAIACDQRGVLRNGERILIACSGGADSTALLDVCIRLAPPREWSLHVVHVDHGLRAEAANDADHVMQMCEANRIEFSRVTLNVKPGPGVQDRARRARYTAMREISAHHNIDIIATGHTADDQAETVLMRALAQATPRSLRGIPVRRGDVARPLLAVWREQTREYCMALKLPYIDDPSNDDRAFTRTKVRQDLLPMLETVFPAARRRLVALAAGQEAADSDPN